MPCIKSTFIVTVPVPFPEVESTITLLPANICETPESTLVKLLMVWSTLLTTILPCVEYTVTTSPELLFTEVVTTTVFELLLVFTVAVDAG